jgi:serpin B
MRAGFATMLAALAAVSTLAGAAKAQPASPAAAPCESAPRDVNLSSEARDAVEGINAFSLDLYRRTLKPNENAFLSPASVSAAAALAYRGAVGTTADEMRGVFHYDADPRAYLPVDAGVLAAMNFCGRDSGTLQTANAIWVQDGLPLKPDYLADVRRYMSAGLHQTNFRADPEAARTDINGWIAQGTHDRIADLLPPGSVTQATQAMLVNTIYWKGAWLSPFDASDTKIETFTQLDGVTRPTSLMHQTAHFAVVERGGVQAIDLPFGRGGDGHVSMVVFLPRSLAGLPKFEAGLTDKELTAWFRALDQAKFVYTDLTLPKIHLTWQADLVRPLQDMGAPTAFGERPDFSAMSPDALWIYKVLHATWLDVDENGAEAAGATAVGVLGSFPPPPIIFRADRPFLFVLRDDRTGLVLFIGRYVAVQPQ